MNYPEPIAISIAQAVHVTGVGRSSLYEEIRLGKLPVRKAGRRSLILVSDLNRWLEQLPARNAQHRAA